jgi:hypothetical protein
MEVSAALDASLAGLADRLAEAPDGAARRRELATIYDLLISTGRSAPDLPIELFAAIRAALSDADHRSWDGLNNRPRTILRLVVAGEDEAAFAALVESAAVAADTTSKVEPAFVYVDGGRAFVWLPGFRDPRFTAPDGCYDISDEVKLRVTVDAAELTRSSLTLGGTAFLTRAVPTSPVEQVALVLRHAGQPDVVVPGQRHRRPDLVSGTGSELSRRAWSGWSVTVDLAALPRASGRWQLALAVDHDGLRRSVDLPEVAGAVAKQEGNVAVRRKRTTWHLDTSGAKWALVAYWDRWGRAHR